MKSKIRNMRYAHATLTMEVHGFMKKESIFVSYAWGDTLEKKEWLRDQIITSIKHPDFSLFWDRDSIPYGRQTIDEIISQALAARPIVVF